MLDFTSRLNFRLVCRVAFWNAFLILAGLILMMAAGEVYFRLRRPFIASSWDREFVSGVGLLYQPHTLVRATDGVEFWTESKVNSLGFLEREPLAPEEAAESCHIAIIGDSFVEAREVQLANRFPVLLEEFAKRDLPKLDVTTSAFGLRNTGQIQQIPFYDQYAKKMSPDLLILVFVANDFLNNSSFLRSLESQWDPDHPPNSYALKSEHGGISLYPPDPEFQKHSFARSPSNPLIAQVQNLPNTFLGSWFSLKLKGVLLAYLTHHVSRDERLIERVNALRGRPQYASYFADWKPLSWEKLLRSFEENEPINVLKDALEFTEFSLDKFKKRAGRSGASLAILATESMSTLRINMQKGLEGRAPIDSLVEMAVARSIPVIDLYNYAIRRGGGGGGGFSKTLLKYDGHWNETGHRLAAEAVLEYLKENPGICDTRGASETIP